MFDIEIVETKLSCHARVFRFTAQGDANMIHVGPFHMPTEASKDAAHVEAMVWLVAYKQRG